MTETRAGWTPTNNTLSAMHHTRRIPMQKDRLADFSRQDFVVIADQFPLTWEPSNGTHLNRGMQSLAYLTSPPVISGGGLVTRPDKLTTQPATAT